MSEPADYPGLAAVRAMVEALPRAAAEELARTLGASLVPASPKAAERRQASLAPLARMVAAELEARDPDDQRPPRIPRRAYDQVRPAGAPSSHNLVRKYGSWLKACRAALALDGEPRRGRGGEPRPGPVGQLRRGRRDGRRRRGDRADAGEDRVGTSEGKPWPTPSLRRRRNHDYTREEVIEAVIAVAQRLGRDPRQLTSQAYYTYVAEKRRRARESGASSPRLPTQRSVERLFSSWSYILLTVRQQGITEP